MKTLTMCEQSIVLLAKRHYVHGGSVAKAVRAIVASFTALQSSDVSMMQVARIVNRVFVQLIVDDLAPKSSSLDQCLYELFDDIDPSNKSLSTRSNSTIGSEYWERVIEVLMSRIALVTVKTIQGEERVHLSKRDPRVQELIDLTA